jgi:tRNA (cmo5U34)-methyltransferase
MRTDRIKAHFEGVAEEFDLIIKKLIPNYREMVDMLVSAIHFPKNRSFSMIDLGCGTGTIAKTIKDSFPNIEISCVDISEKMLKIAEAKIGGKTNCIQADFNQFEFPRQYELIVSSLALHHLENDSDKLEFYRKIYSSLTDDGLFVNLDVVLGGDESIQNIYMSKWIEFMGKNISEEEISKCLSDYYAEDRPAKLLTHIEMLQECGFSCVDVIYKYFNYAVYMGKK